MGRDRARRTRALAALAALVLPLIFVLPLAFGVLGSLRSPGLEPPVGAALLPEEPTWSNYRIARDLVPLDRGLRNSGVAAAIAVPLSVLVASVTGFALAVGSAPLRRRLLALIVVTLMIPPASLWVARFALYRWAGLTDTVWPLVLPALLATSPFFVVLYAVTYLRVPRSIFEAAAVDGAGPWATWWRVGRPLARPTTFAVTVLAFTAHWASFSEPLLYLSSESRVTAPLALRALQTVEPSNHPILLAGAVLVTLPALVVFLFAQGRLLGRQS